MKILCKWFGHKWVGIQDTYTMEYGVVYNSSSKFYCGRCPHVKEYKVSYMQEMRMRIYRKAPK